MRSSIDRSPDGRRPPYRLGLFSWYGYRTPMRKRMAVIQRAGFSASSIWLGRTEPMVRAGEQDLIPPILRDLGLVFEYVHASYTNCNKLWSDDPAEREIIEGDYARNIEYCRRHRVPILVVHVSKGLNPRPPNETGLDVLARLVRRAEDCGVRLAVENTRQPGHIDYILSHLDSPALGFCYDTSHDYLAGPEPGAILARWGHRLLVTHLSDNDGLSDKHWLPGKGIVPWEKIARAFPAETYHGFLTLEVLPKRYEFNSEEEFLSEGIERLRWLEGLIRSARSVSAQSESGSRAH